MYPQNRFSIGFFIRRFFFKRIYSLIHRPMGNIQTPFLLKYKLPFPLSKIAPSLLH